MSRYKKIPKPDIDWKKEPFEIIDKWIDAYFEVRKFASGEILRAEIWKITAVFSWMIAGAAITIIAITS